jgi:hypothetical protein
MLGWLFGRWRARKKKRLPARRTLRVEPLEARNLLAASLVPQLSSRPGAAATLYLDFDGHVEKQWGNRTNVVTPAYDTDGNPASFNAAETSAIREIWSRVAEDYAPFNLNVTTTPPAVIADRVAARMAIGGSYSDWYGSPAGGVAYVGGFAGTGSNVAYIFSSTLGAGNPKYVAEAVSHEAGHLFGAEHQAKWSGRTLVTDYHSGNADWAPIMGIGYYAERTTWWNGATADGPAAYEDALSVIASSTNGFGYAADDYGGTIATAATLPIASSNVNLKGIIGKNDDWDMFKFSTAGGAARFTLDVAAVGANLDGVLELKNATGQTIIMANPSGSLGATLTTTLAAGTYYLAVHSSGGYGNLGQYTVRGSVTGSTPVVSNPQPPATTPTEPSTQPTSTNTTSGGTTSGGTANTLAKIVDDGSAAYLAAGTWKTLTGTGYSADARTSAAGSGGTSTWTFSGLAAGQYRVAATWSGSQLNAKDAPFTISSGGKTLATTRVNQQRAASTFTSGGVGWQNLGTVTITGNTITVKLTSSANGRVLADAIRLEKI